MNVFKITTLGNNKVAHLYLLRFFLKIIFTSHVEGINEDPYTRRRTAIEQVSVRLEECLCWYMLQVLSLIDPIALG